MPSLDVIRRLTIKSSVEGAAETSAALKGIESGYEGVAKVTETSAKRQLSLADAVNKLERQFNSTIKAQQDYERVQRQLNLAVEQNPALQQRANDILDLARQKYLDNTNVLKGGATANDNFARSTAALASQVSSLGGPLGNVAGQVATFSRAAADAGVTAPKAFAGLSGFIGAAVGPLTLVVAGIALATAGYAAYQELFGKSKSTVDEALSEQARLAGLLKDKFDGASGSVKQYSSEVVALQASLNQADIQAKLLEATREALFGSFLSGGMVLSDPTFGMDEARIQFQAFTKQINDLKQGFADSNPDIAKFRDEVSKIANENAGLESAAQALLKLTDAAAKLDPSKLVEMRKELQAVNESAAGKNFQSAIDRLRQMAPEANAAAIQQEKINDAYRNFGVAIASIQNLNPVEFAVKEKAAQDALANALMAVNTVREQTRETFARAEEAAVKHIATMEADTKAVGLGAAAQAEYRTRARLTEAANLEGADAAAKYSAEIEKLANRAGEAAAAFAKAQVASQMNFDRNTVLLSDQDVKIAQSLRTIYGDNIPAALDSTYAAFMRVTEQMRATKGLTDEFATSVGSNVTTALADITTGAKSAGDAFRDLGLSVIRSLEEMIIKILITEPLVRSLKASLNSIFPSLTPTSLTPAALGTLEATGVMGLRGGGIVGRDGVPTLVHPAYFENAPHFDLGGMIADDGVPIIAHPGERVLTRQQSAEYNQGGAMPAVNITQHNTFTGNDPGTEARIRAAIEISRQKAVQEAVKAVQKTRSDTPGFLQ